MDKRKLNLANFVDKDKILLKLFNASLEKGQTLSPHQWENPAPLYSFQSSISISSLCVKAEFLVVL